jgi:Xaa-Pro aminopeptidase
LWIDSRASWALQEALGGSERTIVEKRSPIMIAKAVKTKEELDGFRACHIRDAAALCQYFGWYGDFD